MALRLCFLTLLALCDCEGWKVQASRRVVLAGSVTSTLLPLRLHAAEPEPAKALTDEEMAARIALKQELLKKQGLKGKKDAKMLYGGDYQKGVRGQSDFKPDTSPNLRSDLAGKPAGLAK
mmetsp:Transcript_30140/g.68050  ORF Transcript_30140/g.68050 Transcript_30140/m.68050 type:complete len:120 (+) Transcript_30140:172-531(+)